MKSKYFFWRYVAMFAAGSFAASWVYLVAAVRFKAWDPFLWPGEYVPLVGFLMMCFFVFGVLVVGMGTDRSLYSEKHP